MIIFLGVTGSGKSVQGRLLANEYGYTWISSGEILRDLLTGEKHQRMLSGELLNDKEMIQVIGNMFSSIDLKKQMILDGFPRTITQTNWLIRQAKAGNFELTAIFNFEVSQNKALDRLIKRARKDDTKAAIQKRFEEYNYANLPIIERFRDEGYKIVNINADGSPESIHKNIANLINKGL
jgi:adenylate kinase